jgi:hypothetical protein
MRSSDAVFDGTYVLRTNTALTPLQAVLRYRERWMVEDIFRSAKSLLATRPIFHKYDETIRGHIFCSFLALVMRKELEDRLAADGHRLEWADIVHDLERLSQTEVEQDAKRYILRNTAPGCAGIVLRTLGVALPPLIRCAQPPPTPLRSERALRAEPPTKASGDERRNRPPCPHFSPIEGTARLPRAPSPRSRPARPEDRRRARGVDDPPASVRS